MLRPTENVTLRVHYEANNVSAGLKSYKVLPKEGAYLNNQANKTAISNFFDSLLELTDCDGWSSSGTQATGIAKW